MATNSNSQVWYYVGLAGGSILLLAGLGFIIAAATRKPKPKPGTGTGATAEVTITNPRVPDAALQVNGAGAGGPVTGTDTVTMFMS